MTAHVFSATAIGFEGSLVTVECDTSNSLPGLVLVGLGNKAVDEARERVRSAIKNSALDFPRKRITINLAPANLPKIGSHFDLPIAIAILTISGQLAPRHTADTLCIGELSLDGRLRPVRGVISYAEVARTNGLRRIIVPYENCAQASLVTGLQIIGVKTLQEAFLYLRGDLTIATYSQDLAEAESSTPLVTFTDIYGQTVAKRAVAIAAAGHHNILLTGPPGAGKTMLARALHGILPPLNPSEIIDVTKIHSLAGESAEEIITQRPFRSPHHSASHVSLIGGGAHPRPGEISLAHRGVLFLDELPEYNRQSLEALRQPLEDRLIHLTRASGQATYPADFMLVATQNPCPCGYAGDQVHPCLCSPTQVRQYQKRLSGPLLDRIDMVVPVARVEHTSLLSHRPQDDTNYAGLVAKARTAQSTRYNNTHTTNANLTSRDIQQYCPLHQQAKSLLDTAAAKLNLSARSYFKIIKIARTIADLADRQIVESVDIAEALQYRSKIL